jgi:hypothetical protein
MSPIRPICPTHRVLLCLNIKAIKELYIFSLENKFVQVNMCKHAIKAKSATKSLRNYSLCNKLFESGLDFVWHCSAAGHAETEDRSRRPSWSVLRNWLYENSLQGIEDGHGNLTVRSIKMTVYTILRNCLNIQSWLCNPQVVFCVAWFSEQTVSISLNDINQFMISL